MSNNKKEPSSHTGKLKDFYTFDTVKIAYNANQPAETTLGTKKNYSLITFLNSKRKPDIYSGNGFLSGTQYNHKKFNKEETDDERIVFNNDDVDYPSSDAHEGRYEGMKNKTVRYFNFSQNITIKCFNCGEVGHMSKSCPHEQVVFCIRCNRSGHEDRACPITKCFKCNQYGHSSHGCPHTRKDLIVCERCDHIGHRGYDCLIEPMKVDIHTLKYNNASCYFCGSNQHIVCPFDKKKAPISLTSPLYTSARIDAKQSDVGEPLSEEGEVGPEEKVFASMTNEEIALCQFCPRCGGKHKLSHCRKEDKKNEFDERRLQFSNYIFGKKSYK